MKQWFKCPNCKEKVDFFRQMHLLFDIDDGEADFHPKRGIMFHTIICDCGASWVISMSGMENPITEQECDC